MHGLLIDNFIIHSQSNIHKFIIIYIYYTFNSQVLNYTSHKKQFSPPPFFPTSSTDYNKVRRAKVARRISIATKLQYKTRHLFTRDSTRTIFIERIIENSTPLRFKSYRARRDTAPSIVSSRSSAFTAISFSPRETNICTGVKDFRDIVGLIHRHFRKRVRRYKQKTRGNNGKLVANCRQFARRTICPRIIIISIDGGDFN